MAINLNQWLIYEKTARHPNEIHPTKITTFISVPAMVLGGKKQDKKMAKIYAGKWIVDGYRSLNIGDEIELIERPEKNQTKSGFEEVFNEMYEYELTSSHPNYLYKVTKVINADLHRNVGGFKFVPKQEASQNKKSLLSAHT